MQHLTQSAVSPENVQPFDLTDRGLLLADGVFDTSRIASGRIILRGAHLQRLVRDAAALGIAVSAATLDELASKAVPANADGALRLTVTRGPGARGLAGDTSGAPTLISRFTPMELAYPASPVRMTTSTIRRNPTSPTARHKTLAYTDNVMALRGAVAAGFDDAFLLSPGGDVACATAANVFARFGHRLVTSPPSDGALGGIVRAWLIGQGAAIGFEVMEESLSPERLLQADGIFLTNSLRIFQPVSTFGGRDYDVMLPPDLIGLGKALLEGRSDD
ncbi:MAG: class IV aminotransferase [Hyphomonas sp.]|uniref:aminotransferase class IV n=1 Tax=Hyphomonas sp. TaxID=87 RepID=UPI0017A6253A|nr:aminotransferase class IV [Hyphomonas sp.]MBA3066959.1 class IV aminotransferase [Hyphomonas sp.]MBU4060537.1 aminotransferase class IV [Alphaproteobacteria bacterium]MBU4165805.1 aminotransferase class IV [Alphaproteobacteria bacterium]